PMLCPKSAYGRSTRGATVRAIASSIASNVSSAASRIRKPRPGSCRLHVSTSAGSFSARRWYAVALAPANGKHKRRRRGSTFGEGTTHHAEYGSDVMATRDIRKSNCAPMKCSRTSDPENQSRRCHVVFTRPHARAFRIDARYVRVPADRPEDDRA